jgi:putative addiction module killer protein
MALYRILEYEDIAGRSTFKDWFGSLDAQAAAKISVALTRLAQGNTSSVKGVGGGVLEVRLDFGPGYRIYFGRDGHDLVILLGGVPNAVSSRTSKQRSIDGRTTSAARKRHAEWH